MRVELSEAQTRFVEDRVASGRFGSASEAIDAGIRALAAEAFGDEAEVLHEMVREGLEASDRGETVDGREAIQRLKRPTRASSGGTRAALNREFLSSEFPG